MSEFVKPVRQKVKISDAFAELLGKDLIKDLQENESICPDCHGTGMVIRDNPYGLSNDPDKQIGKFPYKRQSITSCPTCYNGIVRHCPDCGKILPKSSYRCDCDQAWQRERDEWHKKRQAQLDAAEKHEPNALGTVFQMVFSDEVTGCNDGYFSDWEDFFNAWDECLYCLDKDDPDSYPVRPMYVWGTSPLPLTLDAYSILESATEDMHEEAFEEIGDKGVAALQEALDKWKEKYGCGDTYYEDSKHAVRIPWEDYDEEERWCDHA